MNMLTVVETPPNFITDIFFLINAFQHLGIVKTIGTRIRAEKNISEMEKELKRHEAARGEWTGVSAFTNLADKRIPLWKPKARLVSRSYK